MHPDAMRRAYSTGLRGKVVTLKAAAARAKKSHVPCGLSFNEMMKEFR